MNMHGIAYEKAFNFVKAGLSIKTYILYMITNYISQLAFSTKKTAITGASAMKTMHIPAELTLIMAIVLLSACSTMGGPTLSNNAQAELVAKSRASLDELYTVTPEAKHLRGRAQAILVFPDILKAGLLLGGSGGNGVLFSPDGRVMGYYNLASVSYGLQAGAQTFSETMFLMTPGALEYLDSSEGWSIGAGPSVVVVDSGMAKDFSSTTLRSDVFAFVYGQEGVMGGIGVQGQKITKLDALRP